MLGIAGGRGAAVAIGRRQHAAADTAIGTGGACGAKAWIDSGHAALEVRASERPNIMAARICAIGWRERINSRYQSASVISPIKTAPVSRPSAITSFL